MSIESLEQDLQFRRFSAEKQEQIRQLVCYATLMGLEGKDLISIGGTWNRSLGTAKRKENLAKAKFMYNKYKVEGKADHYWEKITRVTLVVESGNQYELSYNYGNLITIKLFTNKKNTTHIKEILIPDYDCGTGKKSYVYKMLVALHDQEFNLT